MKKHQLLTACAGILLAVRMLLFSVLEGEHFKVSSLGEFLFEGLILFFIMATTFVLSGIITKYKYDDKGVHMHTPTKASIILAGIMVVVAIVTLFLPSHSMLESVYESLHFVSLTTEFLAIALILQQITVLGTENESRSRKI